MKKLIILLILMTVVLTGCGSTYEQATGQPLNNYFADGYFAEVYNWGNGLDDSSEYSIVYANDTKVMYIVIHGSHYNSGISPLYNADGSLQIYKEGE